MSRVVLNASGPSDAVVVRAGDVGEELVRAMLAGDRVRVEATAARLRHVEPERLTRNERLAFWINAYNALAMHGVLRLGVTRTVWQVWNFYGRVSYRVGRYVLSLDEIEHGILRANRRRALPPWPSFGRRDPRRSLAVDPIDARIHFALNCAAASCPPVGIYRAGAIDAQLTLAARSFVNQEVALDDGRISCSRIFKWYGGDFGSPAMLSEFLRAHLDDGPVKSALSGRTTPCQAYRPYSWALPHPSV